MELNYDQQMKIEILFSLWKSSWIPISLIAALFTIHRALFRLGVMYVLSSSEWPLCMEYVAWFENERY